jgi:membrane protease YdiL (CAAX protease family)
MKHLAYGMQGNNRWWKYLVLVLASLVGGQTVGSIPLIVVMVFQIFTRPGGIHLSMENSGDLSVFGVDPNLQLFLMIVPFVVSLLVLILLFKPLHKRNYKTMITGSKKIRWSRFFFGAGVWLLLSALYLLFAWLSNPGNFVFNFQLQPFCILVVISVILLPLQSSYEEILCRGYLAQGTAAWTKKKWLAILLPSLFFAALHILNPEVGAYGFWLVMPQYLLFGVVFGIVTVLDDGVELAMGAHSANNVFLSIFVTSKASTLQTSALLIQKKVDPLMDLIVLIISFILFVAILALAFKWDFRSLNKKVMAEAAENVHP